MAPPKEKWVRRFVISETSRHKKGFTIYKVTSIMFLKSSPDVVSKVSVWKRYSDFKKLYNIIQTLHSTLQIKDSFPSFPKPKFFGRFETEVIEERRKCALRLLEFIGRHNSLFTSDTFVKFFESDNLDKRVIDCSQSLSSDTSEDDRNVNHEIEENVINSETDLPKFVCTKKVKPIIIVNQKDDKLPHVNNKANSSKPRIINSTHEHCHINSNNKNTTQNSDVVDGLEALTFEENVFENEDIKNKSVFIQDGSDLTQSIGESVQYVLIAAAHMSAAFRHEAIAEYEEAFTQYKLGISHLINGIQTESDQEKKSIIQEKITQYLQRAERLYNRHLNCNVSVLYKPVTELRNYKVIELIESVMIAKDVLQGFKRVVKTVEKIAGCKEEISSYILKGKVPYMVQLYSCMQTDTTVFLILQYMSKGKLWNFIKTNYKLHKKNSFIKKGHSRSFSCDAIIQINQLENTYTQPKLPIIQVSREEIDCENHTQNNCENSINHNVTGDTTELVKNAQKLLQSVNDTLKRSNSIAIKLNESKSLLYKQNIIKENQNCTEEGERVLKNDSLCIDDNEDIEVSRDSSDFSITSSYTELNIESCTEVGVINDIEFKNELKITEDNNLKNSANVNLVNSSLHKKNDEAVYDQSQNPFQFKKIESNCLNIEKQMWMIPESVVKIWAAEILLALEALHQQNVIVSNLRPDNILIDDYGNVSMTYIVPQKNTELLRLKKPYSSPELCMFTPPISINTSADVWSFGVLLYELLTGFNFQVKHPGQFHSHSLINIPDNLSDAAKSLLFSVLKYQPSDRLTIPEIKQHPFFAKTKWLDLLNAQV